MTIARGGHNNRQGTGGYVLQELLVRADQRGFITLDDILELFDEHVNTSALDALYSELDELGIELRQDGEGNRTLLHVERDTRAADENNTDIGDINAVSADDPVGLYFRQMAQEPLLTAPGRDRPRPPH